MKIYKIAVTILILLMLSIIGNATAKATERESKIGLSAVGILYVMAVVGMWA